MDTRGPSWDPESVVYRGNSLEVLDVERSRLGDDSKEAFARTVARMWLNHYTRGMAWDETQNPRHEKQWREIFKLVELELDRQKAGRSGGCGDGSGDPAPS